MPTRTPLDLRGKSMSELMEMDAEIGSALDSIETLLRFWPRTDGSGNEEIANLLADRRQINVCLTVLGQTRAREARAARDDVIASATNHLTLGEGQALEALLERLVSARVATRVEQRRAGDSGAWWCRTCNFAACGRPRGACPAQLTAAQAYSQETDP